MSTEAYRGSSGMKSRVQAIFLCLAGFIVPGRTFPADDYRMYLDTTPSAPRILTSLFTFDATCNEVQYQSTKEL
jgi:hypothetical protein